jgi:hypothetical protein
MRVDVTAVAKGRRDVALPRTTVVYETGRATLAVAETEQRPTVLGLIASGRMRPDRGTVTIDGDLDAGALRARVALVDAPDVSDPAPNVSTRAVVAEELMFAGRKADPRAAGRFLDAHGLGHLARTPIADVAPTDRLRLMLELAVLRAGVTGVVLVSPDRHGGDPAAWWALAEEFAGRGFAVLVICGRAAADLLAPDTTPEPETPEENRP